MNKNIGVIKRERELQISDLLWKVLYEWRLMVVLAVIFAIVVGGYGALQKWTNNKKSIANDDTYVNSVDSLVSLLTDEERIQINQVQLLDKYIEERQVYMDNSILMNIEPYNKHVLNIIYYIDAGYNDVASVDTTDKIYEAYKAYIVNGGYIDYFVENKDWNLDEKYLLELITIDEDLNKSGVLTICVTGVDSEQIGKIADELKNAIISYKNDVIKSIDKHSMVIMDEYEVIVSDSTLASGQYNMYFNLRNLKSERQALLAKFTDIQTQVYNYYNEGVEVQVNIDNENEINSDKSTENLIDLKYFILGAILGIVFACAWVICKYIFGAKIQSSDDLEEMYGIVCYGTILDPVSDRKILMCIDNLLDKVRSVKKLTYEQQCALCVTDLKIKCKKNNISSLVFLSSNKITDEENKTFDIIANKLNALGTKCILHDDILNNVELFEEFSETSNVILIENIGKTTYGDVETKIKICNKYDVNVLGFIMLM